MIAYDDEPEVVACADCGAEYERASYCGECGYGQEVGELVETEPAPRQEPVVACPVEPRPFPVHEAAWCQYCVAWLGTFQSKEEARAYERSLGHHPFEYCRRRIAKLNGSEEWRLRHHAGKFGSLAAMKPSSPRVPPADDPGAPEVIA